MLAVVMFYTAGSIMPLDFRRTSNRDHRLPVWMIVSGFAACVILLLILPPPYSSLALVGLAAGSIWIGVRTSPRQTPTLRQFVFPIWARYSLELTAVFLILLIFTPTLRNFSPQMRIPGGEFSYLINSGAIAAEVYHRAGAIPLWNPFIGIGEPLLENPFSFTLNPFMTLPLFVWGPVQGAKVAVLIHLALLASGGWMLAYALRLNMPGRLLLALLLGGSGSFIGAVGSGFYQLGLSQAYVPWVYAGLIGLLYPVGTQHDASLRRYVALLAIASTLLIFAGTYWYVLPTAISCGLVIVFALFRRDTACRVLTTWLMVAGLFTLGLAAIRLIPQIIHRDFVVHPEAILYWRETPFIDMLRLLFFPEIIRPEEENYAMYFHFIVPAWFAAITLCGACIAWLFRRVRTRHTVSLQDRWRIIIPAILAITFFTAWSQEGTYFVYRLYETFPLLRQWRYLGRILAAASPWVAVLAAIAFDYLVQHVRLKTTGANFRIPTDYTDGVGTWRAMSLPMLRLTVTGFVLLFGILAATHVLQNWTRVFEMSPLSSHTAPSVRHVRNQHPGEFTSVLTFNYFTDYLPFYETLTRASFGNPDYQPGSIPTTLGHKNRLWYLTEYAVPGDEQDRGFLISRGYKPNITIPHLHNILWQHPEIPSYAYLVSPDRLSSETPLTRSETQPVLSFTHQLNSIHIQVGQYSPGDVLVLTETAYPGWRVTINGEHAPLEAVGGLLGVRLPVETQHTAFLQIVFQYVPTWYFLGAGITLLTAVLLSLYMLRADRLVIRWWRRSLRLQRGSE